jgi:hypothetical protein
MSVIKCDECLIYSLKSDIKERKMRIECLSQSVHTYLGGVVDSTEDELRSAVVAGANVRDVGFGFDQVLSRAKVAQLQNPCFGVQQKILWFNVPVADS